MPCTTSASTCTPRRSRSHLSTKQQSHRLPERHGFTYAPRFTRADDFPQDWTDIPLTLETATPTFGVGLPTLHPWNLSVYQPTQQFQSVQMPQMQMLASAAPPPATVRRRSRMLSQLVSEEMPHRGLAVTSKGNVSATFEVPGLLTIPSDGAAHNVTIVQLNLNAAMSWVCVPKKDAKIHLNVRLFTF